LDHPDPRTLADRAVLVTGASRGIGREIAVRAAADGAMVALLAKTDTPNPKIPGTLAETADAVRTAGGQALPVVCDVRDADAVASAVATIAEEFGAIDIVINNAGALDLRSTQKLPPKNFRRLLEVNVEGPAASADVGQSTHRQRVTAAEHGAVVGRRARGPHGRQVRRKPVDAGLGRGVRVDSHCRQLTLARNNRREHRDDGRDG
jgi:NAD(P)-dependent dehydrogenase (short-subunit alcohol dehydrogenase family)